MEQTLVDEIKALCNPILDEYHFHPVFYDITKTGRHLWIAIYFQIETDNMAVHDLANALETINEKAKAEYQECTCELILTSSKWDE